MAHGKTEGRDAGKKRIVKGKLEVRRKKQLKEGKSEEFRQRTLRENWERMEGKEFKNIYVYDSQRAKDETLTDTTPANQPDKRRRNLLKIIRFFILVI